MTMLRKIWKRALRLFGRKSSRELIAEAHSKGECPEETALEMAEQVAELDDQEGLGEIRVVTDQEE
ncbi:hypothetical protein COV28_01990 [candidate division WWE3 bacterium CG10_big_fil_rev_8_21_14_0_10_48_23]|nr:MAG: hypothetical protein COV28_01990 [candidate division WWE3 bacterium CG10_big_fil_rev_8_21_14_0_10_48_23]